MWQGVARWSHECTKAKVRSKTKTREKSQRNGMCNGNQGVSIQGPRHREEARQIKERWAITNAMCDAKCQNRAWPRRLLVLLQSHRAKVWDGVTRWSHACTEAKVRSKTKTRETSQHNAMRNDNQGVSTRERKHREDARPRKERWAIKNAMCDAKC